MKAALLTCALAATLAACVPAAPVCAPVPAARPSAPTAAVPAPSAPAAPLASDWMDLPQTPGIWRYGAGTRPGEAVFLGEGLPMARLRCERDRGAIVLSLPESGAARPQVTVRTEFMSQRLAAAPAGRETLVTFNPRDPLLDAMALSKGRFMVEADGLQPLILPSWPEVSRVIEDCR